MISTKFNEKSKVIGEVQLFKCEPCFNDKHELINIEYLEQLDTGHNVICQNFFDFFPVYQTAPVAVAIGNGDNGTINPLNPGVVNPDNIPKVTDVILNHELDNGRFLDFGRETRVDAALGTFQLTFRALMPANSYSETISEFGLFSGIEGSVGILTKDSNFLIARRAVNFTKNPSDAVVVVWIITITLN